MVFNSGNYEKIAPPRRGGRGVKRSRLKKYSELCELRASAVSTPQRNKKLECWSIEVVE